MTEEQALALLDMFARYAYNVEFDEFSELFEGGSEEYRLSKYKAMQKDVGHFFGDLDLAHRSALLRLMIKRHNRLAEKSEYMRPFELVDE